MVTLTSVVSSTVSLYGVFAHQVYCYIHMYKEDGPAIKLTVRLSHQRRRFFHI